MGRIGVITGGVGDCVYAIPVARKLKVDTLYVKENYYEVGLGSMYTVLKPLLESQGITCLPTSGAFPFDVFEPGLKYDVNFDSWRIRPGRSTVHIIKNMMLHYRCYSSNFSNPWLFNIQPIYAHSNLIFLTPRWRQGSTVNWNKVLDSFNLTNMNTHFIGHPSDYELFKDIVGKRGIVHFTTEDLLEMAQVIQGCERLFCNQGVALTIAQGLGKNYWLERKPNKTNTLLFTSNEHLL